VQPVELLGLTATPERSDGLPLLGWFDNRIAAELRLWDAIDQRRLVPFVYYGIHDGLDLRDVPWRRGRGYDVAGLSDELCRLLGCKVRQTSDSKDRLVSKLSEHWPASPDVAPYARARRDSHRLRRRSCRPLDRMLVGPSPW
jgi:superfamily II DNA or RNA helicase